MPGWTHSSVPSTQTSFFQIGTTSLRVSISHRQASNDWWRCGVLTATTTLISPSSSRPTRWTRATSRIGQRILASASSSASLLAAISEYASYSSATVWRSPVISRTVPRKVQTAPARFERTRSVSAAWSMAASVIWIISISGGVLAATDGGDRRDLGPRRDRGPVVAGVLSVHGDEHLRD